MQKFPTFSVEDYETYSSRLESYYNDNFPLRSILITLNNSIDYFIFHTASDPRVIIGTGGWLFYSDVEDGDPIGCYQGTNLLSEEQLENIARKCTTQRDLLASKGIEYVLMIVPNKERIYCENMPDIYGKPADMYRALQIVEYLNENTDLRIVYPYDELMDSKRILSEEVYYKANTHWNRIGGYVGACSLLRELGIEMPSVSDICIESQTGEYDVGDLARMLGIQNLLSHVDEEYNLSGYNDHGVEEDFWDFRTYFKYHATGADCRKIYVLRDSFSTNMAEYIGSQFNESYFRYKSTYTYEDFLEQDPDIVVVEVAERYATGVSFSIVPEDMK